MGPCSGPAWRCSEACHAGILRNAEASRCGGRRVCVRSLPVLGTDAAHTLPTGRGEEAWEEAGQERKRSTALEPSPPPSLRQVQPLPPRPPGQPSPAQVTQLRPGPCPGTPRGPWALASGAAVSTGHGWRDLEAAACQLRPEEGGGRSVSQQRPLSPAPGPPVCPVSSGRPLQGSALPACPCPGRHPGLPGGPCLLQLDSGPGWTGGAPPAGACSGQPAGSPGLCSALIAGALQVFWPYSLPRGMGTALRGHREGFQPPPTPRSWKDGLMEAS